MTDHDRQQAIEAMHRLEEAVLHPTPPEKLGVMLREKFAEFVLLLEMAENALKNQTTQK